MSLREVRARFDPEAYEFISREASLLGVSVAEYIRGAALARASFSYARRNPNGVEMWNELYAQAALKAAHESDTLGPVD